MLSSHIRTRWNMVFSVFGASEECWRVQRSVQRSGNKAEIHGSCFDPPCSRNKTAKAFAALCTQCISTSVAFSNIEQLCLLLDISSLSNRHLSLVGPSHHLCAAPVSL